MAVFSTVCLFVLSVLSAAAAEQPTENQVKAAVVFKLTKFVEWPRAGFITTNSALRICSVGDNAVAEALQAVNGRITQGRSVEFVEIPDASRIAGCHLLFVGTRSSDPLQNLDDRSDSRALLTVSDNEGFARRGGIVELTRRGSRLGFKINVANARRAGLTISAPLLELAEIIE